MMDDYTRQRNEKRAKYKKIVDIPQNDYEGEDENEIELSVRIKNKKNWNYKHQICIDHDAENGVEIRVKSSQSNGKKRSNMSYLDRLQEPNPIPNRSRKRR